LSSVLIKAVSDGIAGNTNQAFMQAAAGNSTSSAMPAPGSGMVDAFAGAMINHTTDVIASAVTGGHDSTGLANLGATMFKQAIASKTSSPGDAGAGVASATAPASPTPGIAEAVTGALINHTTNLIASAATGGNDATGLGKLGGALLNKALTDRTVSSAPSPPPVANAQPISATAHAADTVQVHFTPDKGKSKANTSGGPASAAIGKANGNIAGLEKLDPPDGLSFKFEHRLYATNDGVYLGLTEGKQLIVGKRTLGRGGVSGWMTLKSPKEMSNFFLSSFGEEGPDEFSIQWIASNHKYGRTGMNNNAISTSFDTDAMDSIVFVPSGAKMTSIRQWAIANSAGIWLQGAEGGNYLNFTQRYKQIRPISVYPEMATLNEEGTTLFVPNEDRTSLWEIELDGKIMPHDLSAFGNNTINTLIAANDRLWIGYGDEILTLRNGTISLFAKRSGIFALNRPTFCLDGTTLFSADGQVWHGIDITPTKPTSFLQNSATLRQEDFKTVAEMKTAFGLGIYCAKSQGYGPVIYAMGLNLGTTDPKLFVIRPK
jgi:ribosomal protein S6E (S10)